MERKRAAVKLTLTIDKKIIEEAKDYAKTRHTSVSALVEEYLGAVTSASENSISSKQLYQKSAPITESLFGMFADEYTGQEYQELLDAALLERYIR